MTVINPNATQQQMYDDRQVRNGAGGVVFSTDSFDHLRRFLILGSERAQYTASQNADLTIADCPQVTALLNREGKRVVEELVTISTQGRAAKQDPTLFVLALASRHESVEVRKAALDAVQKICRTPTMLFTFLDYHKKVGKTSGWGRLMRHAVSSWYNDKELDSLVYHVTKYGQREGWSHRDVLRLAHPKPENDDRSTFYKWIASQGSLKVELDNVSDKRAFNKLLAIEAAKLAPDAKSVIPLIREFGLVHEHIPTNLQTSPEVWDALLDKMPLNALIRNLGRMTAYGLLVNGNDAAKRVIAKLSNAEAVKRARIHPFNVLTAYNTYTNGGGRLGKLTWSPAKDVAQALNELFYTSFGFIEPSGKRTHIALDVSGSMDIGEILGSPGMSPRMGVAAMAMATLRTEESVSVSAFSDRLISCPLAKQDSLEVVMKKMRVIPMGGTDCALPMIAAEKAKVPVDTFVVYTDNETWAGRVQPVTALRSYRERMGIPARLIVVGMNASSFTIADPTDRGMLDVAGFDSAAPAVIAEFSRGEF
jgi:60 kDa SS-A/Ro ribonucleoprotein